MVPLSPGPSELFFIYIGFDFLDRGAKGALFITDIEESGCSCQIHLQVSEVSIYGCCVLSVTFSALFLATSVFFDHHNTCNFPHSPQLGSTI